MPFTLDPKAHAAPERRLISFEKPRMHNDDAFKWDFLSEANSHLNDFIQKKRISGFHARKTTQNSQYKAQQDAPRML